MMERPWSRLRSAADPSAFVDHFGLLLVITTVAVTTLLLVDLRAEVSGVWATVRGALVTLFVGSTLLIALRASAVRGRWRRAADVVIGLGMMGTIILVAAQIASDAPLERSSGVPGLPWVIVSLAAPLVVIRRLLRHPKVDLQTLLGAVSAYLLIAVAFAFVFLTVDRATAAPFFGTDQPTTSFMYYSLVTLTTLGYGDLATPDNLGRLLSVVEAVGGQVYLVTFVAFVVGLLVSQRQAGSGP